MIITKRYKAEPTLVLFHQDDSFVRGVLGPIGSGKSVAMVEEILMRSFAQEPDQYGRRRTRWAVIRNTYPELKSTTIKTWLEWVPNEVCKIKYDAPINGMMKQALPDGTTIEMEIYFLALDSAKDVKKLLSLELTGAWINEAREIPKSIFDGVTSRVGRFPPKADGPLTWSGVIMDTNPPDDLHWWYKYAEETKPEDYKFWRQPGALIKQPDGRYVPNPLAENVDNQPLGYTYWTRQIAGKDPEWIKVMILAEYGCLFDGKPVYHEMYIDKIHCAENPLGILSDRPLILGWDFGTTPACVVGQISRRGQLRILREFWSDGSGIRQFAENVVKPALAMEFKGFELISTGDPAGAQRSQVDEATCLNELGKCGIPTTPASSNVFMTRRNAVCSYLNRMSYGEPAFMLDPSCKMLRRGFNGGYMFEVVQKVMSGGEVRHKEEPAKNMYSHPHDALQYLAMAADPERANAEKAKTEIMAASMRSQQLQQINGGGYDPFAV